MTTNTRTVTISVSEYTALKKENSELRKIINKMDLIDKVLVKEKAELMKSIPKVETTPVAKKPSIKASCQVYSENNDNIYYVNYYDDITWSCTCPHFEYRICTPSSKSWGCKHIYDVDMKEDLIYN